jgi:hypothetical protein
MPPRALPDHQRLSAETKLRMTPAYNLLLREAASELRLTETQFARASIVMLMRSLAKHDPHAIARAVDRCNDALERENLPVITAEEMLSGVGLPEYGLLTWTESEVIEHSESYEAQLPTCKRITRRVFSKFFWD